MGGLSIFGPEAPQRQSRTERRHQQRRRRRRRRRRAIGPLIAVIVIVGMVGGIFFGGRSLLTRLSEVPDYPGNGTGSVTILVRPGDTASDIAATLVKEGVVKSERAFRDAAKENPKSTSLQPGFYRLRKQMSGQAALALMLDPKSRLLSRLTVPEGLTVAQVLQLISRHTKTPLATVQAAAKDTAALGLPAYAKGRLEGFLFPATYDIEPDTTPASLLRDMVASYVQQVDESGLSQRAAAVGLDPYRLLIVASLIERETRLQNERGKVAQVIYNRLHRNFFLGIDAAVLYGLGRTGGPLTAADLAKVTPYNTRVVKGLPPTPIANPGIASITAAGRPTAGLWLYYVLIDKSGRHLFTADRDEFNKAAARCHQLKLC
jgi:UPF0755 protein